MAEAKVTLSPKRPFFSIVIPTRSRAHLLRYALQSALGQTFDDYEVVVSDNCSKDNTAQVVKALGHSRVRYVRPDRGLSMPDHWEFALDHAQGEYITYLCDDDALGPTLLEETAKTIEQTGTLLTLTPYVSYYAANWHHAARRNCVRIGPYTSRVFEYDSQSTLRDVFTCRDSVWTPRMLNSFCRRDAVFQARAQSGRIFCLCPDYSFAVSILLVVPKWTWIDKPLRVFGMFPEGIGASSASDRGEAVQQYLKELGQEKLLKRVPLKKVETPTNYIAETLLIVKEGLGPKLDDVEIDWVYYFADCWEYILKLEENGVRVEADKEEYLRVLAQQPADLQIRVRRTISGAKRTLKRAARRLFNNSRPFMALATLIPQYLGEPTLIWGDHAGFSNILECARQLDKLLPQTSVDRVAHQRRLGAG